MTKIQTTLLSMTLFALIVTACSGDSSTSTVNTSQQPTQDTVAESAQTGNDNDEPTPTTESMDVEAQAVTDEPTEMAEVMGDTAMDRPDWQTIEFTDARTGETFSLADYAGKTIYVEPMATWCPNCTAQLGNVASARDQLGTDDYVFIGLSLETYLDPADLASHADTHGWDWRFAVLSDDALRTFVSEFGNSFSTAPSTPHFIIRPDGTWTDLKTGMESANALVQQLQAASSGA